jgi:hypothetical protein
VALAAVILGCVIYGVETFALESRRRFMESPIEIMMRALGLAHFLVGWLFLFTSPRIRSLPNLTRLGGSILLGLALCVGFDLAGAGKNPFAVMAFYGLFLVHEVRDESHLYQAYGDCPHRQVDFLSKLSTAVAMTLVFVLAGGYFVNGLLKQHASVTETPVAFLLIGMLALASVAAWMLEKTGHTAIREYGSLHACAGTHGPLLFVYGSLFTILLIGACFGSAGLNLIILIHVSAWLVFVHYQLGRRAQPLGGWWTWLRSHPTGFLVLHFGIALVILVLLALRVHVWQRSGWLSQVLAGSSFPYWSLMHIGMSFQRR